MVMNAAPSVRGEGGPATLSPMDLNVVHVDDRLIVLDKASGLLSQPGRGPDKRDSLATRVDAAYPGARIVHRLDQATSGLIVMARDADTHRRLSSQFAKRKVEKRYEALAWAPMVEHEGEIDLPIRLDLDDKPRQIVDHAQGKPAQTRWRVIQRLVDRTRLALIPRTGRSHQLRLHLREIGHPMLGDALYADGEARAAADRLCLHATDLGLIHPATGQRVRYHSPCPF